MTNPDLVMPQLDFEAIFHASPNAYLLLSPELVLVDVNKSYLSTTGRRYEALIGKDVFEAFPALNDDRGVKLLRASFERTLLERRPDSLALLHYPIVSTTKGEIEDRYWSVTNIPIFDAYGDVALILHHTADVTKLHQLRQQLGAEAEGQSVDSAHDLHRYVFGRAQDVQQTNETLLAERTHLRRLFEQAPGFVCVLRGPEHVFELANAAYCQLVGRQDLMGMTVREALPGLEGQDIYELLDRVYSTGNPFVGRAVRLLLPEGSQQHEVYLDFVYQPITDTGGNVTGIFVQGNDVTKAHQLACEIRHQASHDALTGLVNRGEFERQVSQVIQEAHLTDSRYALLYFDLDQFKVVNDTCGHAAGDELLRYLSAQLDEWAPRGSILARLGGDEFGLLIREESGGYAHRIAEELRELTAGLEFCWGKLRFGIPVSIGVMTFGEGLTLKEILSTADSACFLAKEKGRNRVHVYSPDDDELSSRLREMSWISRLREALHEERLVLHAQRIAPIRGDGNQDRWEVLIRLQEPDGSIVPPMAFIPAAERYNLMPLLDRYVVEKVFRHLASLPAAKRDRTTLSINLSGATLGDDDFLRFVQDLLTQYSVSPARICFEITETMAVANLKQTAHLIRALRQLGFWFALDDFGSGMSSLGYLKHLPVDFIKIDGVFIKDIVEDQVDRAMVEAIAKVASVMGIQTIAEYVENDRILKLLGSLGVDFAQGYGVHRPEPLEGAVPNY
ncbi:EAL domain-containing protein [Litchfieldella xinjiangensis]|uniref:EAL domain-containing protein n=1 Tax=Litchfieldella xinjiangensis TaxID=1166948 RepID=UPI0006945BF9|nr:EAL domain-containing protein [Halomonas xinjiangensis]